MDRKFKCQILFLFLILILFKICLLLEFLYHEQYQSVCSIVIKNNLNLGKFARWLFKITELSKDSRTCLVCVPCLLSLGGVFAGLSGESLLPFLLFGGSLNRENSFCAKVSIYINIKFSKVNIL